MSLLPASLRFRLTLWYACLLALPLIIFAIVCYVVFSRALFDRTDRFIDDALSAFTRELLVERKLASTPEEAMQTTITEVRFPDLRIAILDTGHRMVVSSATAHPDDRSDRQISPAIEQAILESLRSAPPAMAAAVTIGATPDSYRLLSRPLGVRGRAFTIAGAYPLSDIEGVLSEIRDLFALVIPLLVLGAAAGGYFLAKRSLAPMSVMTSRAAAISAANLHERLPVAGGAEIVGLARMINELLDRLEASFEQQRRFMADASHELRTPSAIIRTEADVTLSRDQRSEPEYRESLTVIRDAGARLARIVDDLFLLARADSGHLVPRMDAVYLDEVLHDAVRGVRPVAEARGVSVALGAIVDAAARGDAHLLDRLFLNLLDNAIKHSPSGGVIDVAMAQVNNHIAITVTDAGAGIPVEAQPRVFERFFRADAARERSENNQQGGAGLGLAIARRIAELHGGAIELVQSRPGFTQFRVTLPVVMGTTETATATATATALKKIKSEQL